LAPRVLCALSAGQETGERLEQQREDDGRHNGDLAHSDRWEPYVVPKLAQPKAGGRHHQDREIGPAAVAKERIEELGEDQHP
jgi:hypothetical protein